MICLHDLLCLRIYVGPYIWHRLVYVHSDINYIKFSNHIDDAIVETVVAMIVRFVPCQVDVQL